MRKEYDSGEEDFDVLEDYGIDELVQNETVLANEDYYYSEENGQEDVLDSSMADEDIIGQFTKVVVVPPGEIQKRQRRWKKSTTQRGDIDENLVAPVPNNVCSVCRRVFSSAAFLQQHVCKGSKDPQDMLSFAILEAERIIRQGEVEFVQREDAVRECVENNDMEYVQFQSGWAIRPPFGKQYGKKYLEKYADDIVKMFSDGLQDKALRRGPNRMLEMLRQKYPGAHDLPSESEIRMAVSRLMQQNKNQSELSLSSGRGRKSKWPAIIEYLLVKFVNEDPEIKPAIALTAFKEKYETFRTQFPIDDMPNDAKIKQKVSSYKTKYKKKGPMDLVMPEPESE